MLGRSGRPKYGPPKDTDVKYLGSLNVTKFGNRVFAEVFK